MIEIKCNSISLTLLTFVTCGIVVSHLDRLPTRSLSKGSSIMRHDDRSDVNVTKDSTTAATTSEIDTTGIEISNEKNAHPSETSPIAIVTSSEETFPKEDPAPATASTRSGMAVNDTVLEDMVCEIVQMRGGKKTECPRIVSEILEPEVAFLKSATPFDRFRTKAALPACVVSGRIESLWFVGDSMSRYMLESLAKRWPKVPGTVPPKLKSRFKASWFDSIASGGTIDVNYDFQSRLEKANFTRLMAGSARRTLFVVSGGIWHQRYFGTPPSGAYHSVLRGLSNLHLAASAPGPVKHTLVYYLPHCTRATTHDAYSRCFLPSWSMMWRRAAACAVVQHWSDHPSSNLHAYDPCGVLERVADPPDRWDGSHFRDLQQHLVADDMLRRFVCPNSSSPTLPGSQAWSRETATTLAAAFECNGNVTDLDRDWKYSRGCSCQADSTYDECDLTLFVKNFPRAMNKKPPIIANYTLSDHPAVQMMIHVKRLKRYWATTNKAWNGLRPELVKLTAQMDDILSTLCYHPESLKLCLLNLGAHTLTRVERTNVSLTKRTLSAAAFFHPSDDDSVCRCIRPNGSPVNSDWCAVEGKTRRENWAASMESLDLFTARSKKFTIENAKMRMMHAACVRKFPRAFRTARRP